MSEQDHVSARVRAAMALGRHDLSRAALAELVEDEPDSGPAWEAYGRVSAAMGDHASARAALEQAVELEPNSAGALALLAQLLAASGAALPALARAWAASRLDAAHLDLLARIAALDAPWTSALDVAERQERIIAADAFHGLSRVAIDANDWERAGRLLDLALTAEPDHVAAHLERISVNMIELPIPLTELWKYRQIIESTQALRRVAPFDPRTWRTVALLPCYFGGLKVAGAEPAAACCAIRWLNAAPDSSEARVLASDASYSRRRMKEAVEVLTGILVPDPTDWPEAWLDDFLERLALLVDQVAAAADAGAVGKLLMDFGLMREAGNYLLLAARTNAADSECGALLGEAMASFHMLTEALPHLAGLAELPPPPLVARGGAP